MTQRCEVPRAPGLLEEFAQHFDELFAKRNQRDSFRRYLEGLLLPAERNKTLTGLANTTPGIGAQEARAQSLQWFLSESNWDENAVNARRCELLRQTANTAPNADGVLVIDETGDVKAGAHTAHVGRQYLGNVGKIDNGVVSVSSLWANEQVYYPLEVIAYTPAAWFAGGRTDPAFRTKLMLAVELVKKAVSGKWPFKAVVADSFYGEDANVRQGLQDLGVHYVMALKPSHSWWHSEEQLGSLDEVARATPWTSAAPGAWQKVERTFRDGHRENWWALGITAGPYGPRRRERAVVVTTDPQTLPELSTWYLVTNLSIVAPSRAKRETGKTASVAEVVRLYGLRAWVEQGYKQVKMTLGWAEYQVRNSRAIQRHWILVYCAFTFCWWQSAQPVGEGNLDKVAALLPERWPLLAPAKGEKKSRRSSSPKLVVAQRTPASTQLAGTRAHAQALLARLFVGAPARGASRFT